MSEEALAELYLPGQGEEDSIGDRKGRYRCLGK